MKQLQFINIPNWKLQNQQVIVNQEVSYQIFGQIIGTAPIVLVNHALTGNSNVSGDTGWWNDLIGQNQTIDTNLFTIIAINIPGNGFDNKPENLIQDYHNYTIRDIAQLFWQTLNQLNVQQLFAIIGGSLGGAIAWEMFILQPNQVQNLIPIATDTKATDWMIANVHLQDNILNNSKNPIQDARTHAMLLYRTPQSINQRFNQKKATNNNFEIQNWLIYHGETLKNRFQLSAFKLMNHLLKTNNIEVGRDDIQNLISNSSTNIYLVSVDSDLFFTSDHNILTYNKFKKTKSNIYHHQIKSVHGHDAFLIEFKQLSQILNTIFQSQKLPYLI